MAIKYTLSLQTMQASKLIALYYPCTSVNMVSVRPSGMSSQSFPKELRGYLATNAAGLKAVNSMYFTKPYNL